MPAAFSAVPWWDPQAYRPTGLKFFAAPSRAALKDPELKVEAEKRSYELEPVGGDEMERLAKDVMAQPPEVIERMKKVLGK